MQDSRWSLVKSARQTGARCDLPRAMTMQVPAWIKSNHAGTYTLNQPSRSGPLRIAAIAAMPRQVHSECRVGPNSREHPAASRTR